MLEMVEFGRPKMPKEDYKAAHDALMERLVTLQQQARSAGVGLVVLFEGWNGAGKGSRISDLMYHLDARATSVHVGLDLDVEEERSFAGRAWGVTGYYPLMQEFWKALGERSSITFYDRGWYTAVIQHMLHSAPAKLLVPKEDERHYLESIHDFERQLSDDGYTVVKFFVHVTKEGQLKRLRGLRDDPATRWRVPKDKLESAKNYDAVYQLYDRLLERSDYDFAPWVLIDGEDSRRANLTIARTLVEALEQGIARKAPASAAPAVGTPGASVVPAGSVPAAGAPRSSRFPIVAGYPQVDAIDHGLTLGEEDYRHERKGLQKRLFRLENLMYQRRVPLMIMYEGWDAAGKGGNIKRVAQALDARAYTIFPSPAPTKPELAHPFLWRYWTRLPKAGHVGMYDRSWYGRVLVERVEGFAAPDEWARAYDEINEFEHDLVDWGAILLKFWVDVSPEEQLRRFREREANPAKQWKITPDDWRNRDKYPEYKAAIDDMFRLTSTTYAPWVVLESDDKRYARVKALRLIVEALEERLGER